MKDLPQPHGYIYDTRMHAFVYLLYASQGRKDFSDVSKSRYDAGKLTGN